MESQVLTIILAAGKGTRMKSGLAKVLHPVAGKPMISHVINSASPISSSVVVIVGYQGDKVKETLGTGYTYVRQEEQLGTGHAVLQAKKLIKKHQGQVLILCGDTPLLREKTLSELVDAQRETGAGVAVLTADIDNPRGYGRIIRNEAGNQIIKIVEDSDASDEERLVNEINSGVYCFDSNQLSEALENLTNDNAQGEYYLTDTIAYLRNKGEVVVPVKVDDSREIIGVNDRRNLARAERVLRNRIINYHLANGVSIIDPDTTYIDSTVEIGQDSVIYPFTYIEGRTRIGSEVVVGPHSHLINAEIGDRSKLLDSTVIKDSKIGEDTNIGPFAYIRPGCQIASGVKVGDFVELKKAKIGENTKVPHLSYVGDAEIGENSNIGAGTIFANYDGKKKHKTKVGNNAFIGSNTTLIAPVTVGNRGKTGAGAVVTKDVPGGVTVVGVPARKFKKDNIEGDK
ncbi:bifunctional UDP-N-acetylglucosamine diphosphorylase/glucosamine-1-phosphate N-acetyltransferase GlmU [Halothermothrix orenii]|uniref:Bifunctional protein GlmU n=1 Tax=Halothermothrix orenii (strain H 168 / OCM 544 / DSM 9562) TaxID=373903 RepID=B8D017_HALOH|nr:bifunctional UDP-N-acetylglucosamine diphosphorylase/glucosamine-1-phosphate N-acetyltransferase GlmU [Halothermothrix orenii]ACL70869.1 UDP-N-acetylglucosamine pyrophosphorylase [Halothermothrix orenii H 168]